MITSNACLLDQVISAFRFQPSVDHDNQWPKRSCFSGTGGLLHAMLCAAHTYNTPVLTWPHQKHPQTTYFQ